MLITKSCLTTLRVGIALFCLALLAAATGVQAAPKVASVTISSKSATGGTANQINGTVALTEIAGVAGVEVRLKSSYVGVKFLVASTRSSSVTVPQGSKSAQFQIVTPVVDAKRLATITASNPDTVVSGSLVRGGTAIAELLLTPFEGKVTSVSVAPTEVTGGVPRSQVNGTVTLAETVDITGGVGVPITSDNAAASIGTVTVPTGANSARFSVFTSAVGAKTAVNITASLLGSTATAPLVLVPPAVKSVSVSPFAPLSGSQFPGGPGANMTVELTVPAPVSVITAFSGSPNATINPNTQQTVSNRHNFFIVTVPVDVATPVDVGAATAGGDKKGVIFTLIPPSAARMLCGGFTVGPSVPIVGGTTLTNCVVELDATPTAKGITIPLSSSMSGAIPSTVFVKGGVRVSDPFSISSMPVSISTPVAFSSGTKQIAMLTVLPPAVRTLVFSSPNPVGGTGVTASITLNGAAPTGGINVPISSGNTAAATVPGSVSIAAGQDSGSVPINTLRVTNDTNVSITAGATSASLVVRAGP